MADTTDLESRLEELLEQDTFAPPDEFRENAVVSDDSIYDEADKDYEGFWEQQAEALDWETKWDQVLDWSDPPNAKWFVGGKLNVAHNCVDRHVEAGNGDRVAFHWRGEEGEERDITYADLHRDVQRFANGLKGLGVEAGDVVGIFLPMIPEVVVAMLACARIGAPHNVVFGGFSVESVKERMEVSEAKVLITVDGARRKGKTAEIKKDVDECMGDLKSLEHIVVVQHVENDAPMDDDRDRWYHELCEEADDECPAEGFDSEHPLYILYSSGSTAKPKGILHTTGGYLTGVAYTHRVVFDLKPGGGRLLVLGRRRLGHRALLHRLRAARQRHHLGDVRGSAGLPGQGCVVGRLRALRRHALLHRADRDPRVHEVGRRVPREARPVIAAPARHGR
jgi:acetyl-CoA synthetase